MTDLLKVEGYVSEILMGSLSAPPSIDEQVQAKQVLNRHIERVKACITRREKLIKLMKDSLSREERALNQSKLDLQVFTLRHLSAY